MKPHFARSVNPWLVRILAAIVLLVLGLIVLHAPLTVFLGSQFPDYSLIIKGWKEALLLLGLAVAAVVIMLDKARRSELVRNPLLWLIAGYAALHLLLASTSSGSFAQVAAGLAIDLRYLGFFVLAYLVVQWRPDLRKAMLVTAAAGASVVLLFGILQVFVLPKDVLVHIGYGPTTITPYQTIDQNEDYIRINSTLRGPNPLGAYVIIAMTTALAYLLWHPRLRRTAGVMFAGTILVLAPAVLWSSYSRSAVVAALAAISLVVLVRFWGRLHLAPLLLVSGMGILVLASGLYALRDTSVVQNVIVHRNPADANEVNSNEDHAASLAGGTERALSQPFGAGIGSAGSASLLGEKPLIVENQYLFIARESGWMGLALFLAILATVGYQLWRRRHDWLALSLLASGLGLSAIGLLLPVWADDTVSLVWWGLAAVALASRAKDDKAVLS